MLTTRIRPKISVKPLATRKYRPARVAPSRSVERKVFQPNSFVAAFSALHPIQTTRKTRMASSTTPTATFRTTGEGVRDRTVGRTYQRPVGASRDTRTVYKWHRRCSGRRCGAAHEE